MSNTKNIYWYNKRKMEHTNLDERNSNTFNDKTTFFMVPSGEIASIMKRSVYEVHMGTGWNFLIAPY